MEDWKKVYDKLLEGFPLDGAETRLLEEALKDSQITGQARDWIAFDLLLTGSFEKRNFDIQESQERLFAKSVLKEKHASLVEQKLIAHSGLSTVEPCSKDSILESRGSGRFIRLWERAGSAWVTAAVVLLGLGIALFSIRWEKQSTTYANPVAFGEYRVLGKPEIKSPQKIQRGDRISSIQSGVQLDIGNYCNLELESQTDVTVKGLPFQEEIELHHGVLKAKIKPDVGKFLVRTPLGAVVVKGTEFKTSVEYPHGIPGAFGMDNSKKVIVIVSVITGSVFCDFGQSSVFLKTGEKREFEDFVNVERTTGVVTSKNELSVTLKLDSGKTVSFQIGSNKLAAYEAEQLLIGDKITIVWRAEDDKRLIRDIQGEGKLEGRIKNLGDTWIEVEADNQNSVKLRAPWRGGDPSDGGGPDQDIIKKIGSLKIGDLVTVTWAMPEGKRVTELTKRVNANNEDSPPGLRGFRGILAGELVSKDIENGTLVIRLKKVQRVWETSIAPSPEKSIGKLIKIKGISGKHLAELTTFEIGNQIEVEAFQEEGSTLRFPGEWLKKAM